ncbi:zinc-binding dehydrogenase [Paracraurococcus lichenis]|uniref:Zinc-binding dehydrogenase n=1 Tax=Paracraurococcus lichenis TaxID=3064888 RepID=A0ABT9DSA9_9PROT|nr:zinc-binding dehydrogenase [Paracraurococcus sp. LOR1-02]MDO9706775.1 zinc-binding dehydrogenase [Paracraurococcus sp. LOR1-02]
MRAAVFEGIGRPLALREVPEPQIGPGDLLLQVALCGICGSDLHASEVPDYRLQPGTILGHEFAGTVIASGDPAFRPGDRLAGIPFAPCAECEPFGECRKGLAAVCPGIRGQGFSPAAPGAYAERVRIRASQALRLPDGVGFEAGAMLEPLAVGAHAVAMAEMPPGARVLVTGAGPIGLAVAVMARLSGAGAVVVSEPASARRARAARLGATAVLDPNAAPLAEAFAEAAGGPPDLIFECVGIPGMLQRMVELAPPRCRIVVVGVCMEEDRLRPRMAIRKELSFRFVLAYTRADFAAVLGHVEAGAIRVEDFVTEVIGLGALPAGFEALRRPADQVKVLVDPAR